MLKYILFAGIMMLNVIIKAQINGKVTDSVTQEALIGANVFIDGLKVSDYVGLNGTYALKKVHKGRHTVSCRMNGYKKQEMVINLGDSSVVLNFQLNVQEYMLSGSKVIVNRDKGSDGFARNSEKNSGNIVNIISAKTIQLLPDITTASVLQRISGVSLERTSTGDARYAIIRGMDQRYNYTLVNGIKIPSPDNKFRYVPMDMFPADLLERLEVIKALTPGMEGDAIGGVMNLVMKNAPDKLTINANLGTGFSQLLMNREYSNFDRNTINSKSPSDIHGTDYIATPYDFTYKNFDYASKKIPLNSIIGFSIGNRFLQNKKLGVIVAGSFQNLYRGSNSIWFQPENQPQPGNKPSFNDIFVREYNTQQSRYGLHAKIDYVFNPSHKISLYNLFMKMDELQYRHTIDTSLSIGRTGSGSGNTYILHRSRIQKQSIYNATLQGNHELFRNFKLNWSGVYSIAKSNTPDWSEYQTVQVVGHDMNGNQTSTPQVLNIPFYRIWTRNSDRDLTGYLNMSYYKKISAYEVTLTVGGLYRDKLRNNHFNEWDLIPKTSSTGQPVVFDGTLTPGKFQFNGASAAQGNPVNPLTYTATEKILAYYAEANIVMFKQLSILGGVRYEKTKQGWVTAQDPKISYGAIGVIPYHDVLPSVHAKYMLSKKQHLRLSYFSAINRPGFFEYVPYKINDDNFNLSGNPKLKHTTSNNFDFRYEFFPKSLDQVLIGAFYKDISNPIETAVEFTGTSSATLKPFNFGRAKNYGFELSVMRFFGHVGISGNYTYTHSRIATSKLFYNTSFVAEQTTQTRPLQGQSPHIGNISTLYKHQKIGLDMQLALVYTGKKITFVSPYKDLDYWQKETFQLDFSIEKRIFKFLTIYSKINNILNTPVIVEIHQPNIYQTGKFALTEQTNSNKVTVQKEYYGQNFIFGIRFTNLNN